MRLYPRNDTASIHDPEYGQFDANPDGSFDLPDDLAERLHSFHDAGRKVWETNAEKTQRLAAEELARRRDPASAYEALQEMREALLAQQTPRRGRPPKQQG